jgi:hypothetical protein
MSAAVTVNISSVQLERDEVILEVATALNDSGLDPSGLILELTESAKLAESGPGQATLRELQHMGVRIALDDFGTGFASLDDAQLRLLARAIVDEIRYRTQFYVRTPVDRQLMKGGTANFPERKFRGATTGSTAFVPTPFLGLAQFVNRFLDLTVTTPSTNFAVAKAGCLQSAIARAEADGGEITNRATVAPIFGASQLASGTGAGQQSWTDPLNSAGVEIVDAGTRSAGTTAKLHSNQSHVALFAPGSVLQQDILAAIGPHITARSDTFIIRAYGEVRAPGGSDIARGRAWVEAVVQRTPDFCNTIDSAETITLTKASNKALGRRFRIVSVRWLGPNEI